MARHLRHRHALAQAQNLGIEVQVPLRPAIAAVNLEQLPLSDEVTNRHGLQVEGLRLAAAPGLVPILRDSRKAVEGGGRAIC
jgi:hypothetical protein